MRRGWLGLPIVLLTCSTPDVPAPSVAIRAEGDADTDVDADADPMCSAYAPDVAWQPAPPGDDATRVRMRADWDCSGYAPELEVLCDDLKRVGMPVWGADQTWWLSGASRRWSGEIVAQLRALPPEAFVASAP
jgi:hypothetical protein